MAVVLGAGMAGMLAAAALARHADRVLLVDRDRLPDGPSARKGLPQGRHAHVLMSSGARAIDELVPGTTDRLLAAGAHRVGLPGGYVMLLADGWMNRFPGDHFVISCTRPLLDLTIREGLRTDPAIVVRDETDVLGLTEEGGRVTGVRLRDRASGAVETVVAEFVVDATGHGSRAARWLADLGYGTVRTETVDSGLVYATRLFRAPGRAADRFPVVNVQAETRSGRPGQTAALLPVEDGRWLVTLSGTRGGEPTGDADRFVDFARRMRHPVVGDLVAGAEPLGPVHVTRTTANRRNHFAELPSWPVGFVVAGDAVASFNPVYGHGMTVAARAALALRGALAEHGTAHPAVAVATQHAIARLTREAWDLATGTDIHFPGTRGRRPSLVDRVAHWYTNRLLATAATRPDVARAVVEVFTLSAPATRLLAPATALAGLRGPGRGAAPTEPPFTEAELAALRG